MSSENENTSTIGAIVLGFFVTFVAGVLNGSWNASFSPNLGLAVRKPVKGSPFMDNSWTSLSVHFQPTSDPFPLSETTGRKKQLDLNYTYAWVLFQFYACVLNTIVCIIWTGGIARVSYILSQAPKWSIVSVLFFSLLWGIGSVAFGQACKIAGVGLGTNLTMGVIIVLGSLLPLALEGQLLTPTGGIVLTGLGVCCLGLFFSMVSLKVRDEDEKEERKRLEIEHQNRSSRHLNVSHDSNSHRNSHRSRQSRHSRHSHRSHSRSSGQDRLLKKPMLSDISEGEDQQDDTEGSRSSMVRFALENIIEAAEPGEKKPRSSERKTSLKSKTKYSNIGAPRDGEEDDSDDFFDDEEAEQLNKSLAAFALGNGRNSTNSLSVGENSGQNSRNKAKENTFVQNESSDSESDESQQPEESVGSSALDVSYSEHTNATGAAKSAKKVFPTKVKVGVCLFAGILSSQLQFAFVFGRKLAKKAEDDNTVGNTPASGSAAIIWLLCLPISVLPSIIYCIYSRPKNTPAASMWKCPWWRHVILFFTTSVPWISAIHCYGYAASSLLPSHLAASLAWPLQMMTTVGWATFLSCLLGEWKTASARSWFYLMKGMVISFLGMLILMISIGS